MKNLLKMSDLSNEDIVEILDLAEQLKYELKNGIEHFHLKGKTLGLIFEKGVREREYRLKSEWCNLEAILFFFREKICKSTEENPLKIRQECCQGIWTE